MSFDQFDGIGRNSRGAIGIIQTPNLAFGLGGIDGISRTVARCSNPLENGVNTVTVALGIDLSLEDKHPDPLAQDRAVGFVRERFRIA